MAVFARLCRRWQTLALVLLIAGVAVEGYLAVFRRFNDFMCHRNVGQAFLDGEPYGAGCELYPVGRTLMNSLLACGPLYLSRGICFLLAIAALVACFRSWRWLGDVWGLARCGVASKAAFLTLLLVCPFILRDLDECGLQIFVLFFLTAAAMALMQGRTAWCGFWLATAATYKVTPILFLPYLLWKRQWRAAGWTVAFIAMWATLPAVFVGVDTTLQSHERWLTQTIRVGGAQEAYPSLLEIEAPKPQNLSFHALVARYLITVPEEHALYLEHPWFDQFGTLEPLPAYVAVRGALLLLGGLLLWRFHRRWQDVAGKPQLASEWATLCILAAILSPLCWKQHLVLMLPAVYLTARAVIEEGRWFTWRVAGLAVIGAVILLSRHSVVGKELSIVLLSYKLDTLAVLLSMFMVLRLPALAKAVTELRRKETEKAHEPESVGLKSGAMDPDACHMISQ